MERKRQGKRFILISPPVRITKELLEGAMKDTPGLQGVVVFDKYVDQVKDLVDFLSTRGHQKYSAVPDYISRCSNKTLPEKVSILSEFFSIVFVVGNDLEILYQELTDVPGEILILK